MIFSKTFYQDLVKRSLDQSSLAILSKPNWLKFYTDIFSTNAFNYVLILFLVMSLLVKVRNN